LNYYNRNAKQLFDKYQKLNPDELHAYWLKHLPRSPGLALDIGHGLDSEGIKFYQVPAGEIVQFAEKKSLHVEVSYTGKI